MLSVSGQQPEYTGSEGCVLCGDPGVCCSSAIWDDGSHADGLCLAHCRCRKATLWQWYHATNRQEAK
jgi:hypothetical protein